jgi:hypothetical protein
MKIELSQSEMNELAQKFHESRNLDSLEQLLSIVNRSIQDIAPEVQLKKTIDRVLADAQKNGWLEALLNEVVSDTEKYGDNFSSACQKALKILARRRFEYVLFSPENPCEALLMKNGEPLVDRDHLRADFRRIVENNLPNRVVIVRGPSAAGKSHLWFYCRHMAPDDPAFGQVCLDIGKMTPDQVTAHYLMQAFADKMRLTAASLSSDELAQEARIAEKLCNWFIGQSQTFHTDRKRWWIVLDTLNSPRLSAGALDFVHKLAIAIARDEVQCSHLLLLGLPDPVPHELTDLALEVDLAGLTEDDIRSYISQYAQRSRRTLDPDGLDLLVQTAVKDQSHPYGHEEMRAIRQWLKKELPEILGMPPVHA